MSNKNDDDMGSLGGDDGIDLDGIDMDFGDGIKTDNINATDRKPISKIVSDSSKSFKEAFTDDKLQTVLDLGRASIPRSLSTETSVVTDSYGTIKDEVTKQGNKLRIETRRSLKAFKRFLPENGEGFLNRITNKVAGVLGESDSSRGISGPSQAERIAAEITGLMGEKTSAEKTAEEFKSQLEFARAKSVKEIQITESLNVERMRKFLFEVTDKYYRTSLDVSLRQLYTSQELLAVTISAFDVFKTSLSAIIKNTSLPEVVKINGRERLGDHLKRKFTARAGDAIFKQGSPIKKATDKISSLVGRVGAAAADTLAGVTGNLEQGEALSGQMGAGDVIGMLATDIAKTLTGRFIGKKISDNKDGQSRIYDIKNAMADPLKAAKDARSGTGVSAVIGGAFATAAGSGRNTFNIDREDPNAAAYVDNRTKDSINKVIPALLSKIYSEVKTSRELQTISSGKGATLDSLNIKSAESKELIYDSQSSTLITRDKLKESIRTKTKKDVSSNIVGVADSLVRELVLGNRDKFSDDELKAIRQSIIYMVLDKGEMSANIFSSKKFKANLANTSKELANKVSTQVKEFKRRAMKDPDIQDKTNRLFKQLREGRTSHKDIAEDLVSRGLTSEALSLGLITQDDNGNIFGNNSGIVSDIINQSSEIGIGKATVSEASFKERTKDMSLIDKVKTAGSDFGKNIVKDPGDTPDSNESYAKGGYTKDGSKFEKAGKVHRGEFVINKDNLKSLLDAVKSGDAHSVMNQVTSISKEVTNKSANKDIKKDKDNKLGLFNRLRNKAKSLIDTGTDSGNNLINSAKSTTSRITESISIINKEARAAGKYKGTDIAKYIAKSQINHKDKLSSEELEVLATLMAVAYNNSHGRGLKDKALKGFGKVRSTVSKNLKGDLYSDILGKTNDLASRGKKAATGVKSSLTEIYDSYPGASVHGTVLKDKALKGFGKVRSTVSKNLKGDLYQDTRSMITGTVGQISSGNIGVGKVKDSIKNITESARIINKEARAAGKSKGNDITSYVTNIQNKYRDKLSPEDLNVLATSMKDAYNKANLGNVTGAANNLLSHGNNGATTAKNNISNAYTSYTKGDTLDPSKIYAGVWDKLEESKQSILRLEFFRSPEYMAKLQTNFPEWLAQFKNIDSGSLGTSKGIMLGKLVDIKSNIIGPIKAAKDDFIKDAINIMSGKASQELTLDEEDQMRKKFYASLEYQDGSITDFPTWLETQGYRRNGTSAVGRLKRKLNLKTLFKKTRELDRKLMGGVARFAGRAIIKAPLALGRGIVNAGAAAARGVGNLTDDGNVVSTKESGINRLLNYFKKKDVSEDKEEEADDKAANKKKKHSAFLAMFSNKEDTPNNSKNKKKGFLANLSKKEVSLLTPTTVLLGIGAVMAATHVTGQDLVDGVKDVYGAIKNVVLSIKSLVQWTGRTYTYTTQIPERLSISIRSALSGLPWMDEPDPSELSNLNKELGSNKDNAGSTNANDKSSGVSGAKIAAYVATGAAGLYVGKKVVNVATGTYKVAKSVANVAGIGSGRLAKETANVAEAASKKPGIFSRIMGSVKNTLSKLTPKLSPKIISFIERIKNILPNLKKKIAKKLSGRLLTKALSSVASRFVPILGIALLVVDVGRIIYFVSKGDSFLSATSKAIIGIDVFSDSDSDSEYYGQSSGVLAGVERGTSTESGDITGTSSADLISQRETLNNAQGYTKSKTTKEHINVLLNLNKQQITKNARLSGSVKGSVNKPAGYNGNMSSIATAKEYSRSNSDRTTMVNTHRAASLTSTQYTGSNISDNVDGSDPKRTLNVPSRGNISPNQTTASPVIHVNSDINIDDSKHMNTIADNSMASVDLQKKMLEVLGEISTKISEPNTGSSPSTIDAGQNSAMIERLPESKINLTRRVAF